MLSVRVFTELHIVAAIVLLKSVNDYGSLKDKVQRVRYRPLMAVHAGDAIKLAEDDRIT